jgi:hypothetical protein
MKKYISIIVIFILLLNAFSIVVLSQNQVIMNNNENEIEINIKFPTLEDIEFKPYQNKQIISHDIFGYYCEPGKIMLPSKNINVLLPFETKIDKVTLIEFNPKKIPESYEIATYPQVYTSNSDIKSYELNTKKTSFIPEENIIIKQSGSLRKYSYVSLSINPFKYNKETNSLFYDQEFKIKINYLPIKEKGNNEVTQQIFQDHLSEQKASELFINYYDIRDEYLSELTPISENNEAYKYLILTTDSLIDSIYDSDFIDWKTIIGHDIQIITTSDNLITSQTGRDFAEQIRNFLREYYLSWNIKYLLIVGDYTSIPMRYCSPNPSGLAGTVPTDSYYADLSYPDDESWDSNNDGYYGVYGQDNPDFMPEIYVGRIPTNNELEIIYTLNKIVTFEKDTDSWKNNALQGGAMLFYANEDHDTTIDFDIDGARLIDEIEKNIMNNWTTSHYSEIEGLSPSIFDWPALNEPSFTSDWRDGKYAIVNWAAHGAPSSIGRVIWNWDDGDEIPEHENGELGWGRFLDTYCDLEDDYPSIVFAVSCNVGRPEITPEGNLGIDMLTKESFGSAVGVCSSTRGAAVSADWLASHSGAEALCYEFNRYMVTENEPIGDALYDSKFYVHSNFGWDHPYEYMNMYDYNLYGDPSMIRQGVINSSPTPPEIIGPINGKMDIEYDYKLKSIDPTEDQIFYYIDWGDEEIDEWIGPYPSGEEITVSHTWTKEGTFIIKAKAKDINGNISDYSTISVSMPKNNILNNFNSWIFQLIQRLKL